MEDRRTLIAFALIGAVLVLLPYYYRWVGIEGEPEKEVFPTDVAREENDIKRPIDQNEDNLTFDTPPNDRLETFVERDVVVTTDIMELIFSTKGGVIRSCKLSEYEGLDNHTVQLIPSNGRGMVLSFEEEDEDISLSKAEFVPDNYELVVQPEGTGTLRMRCNLGQNRFIVKTYTFKGSEYAFNFEIEYSGFSIDESWRIKWVEGVDITEKDPAIDIREAKALSLIGGTVNSIQVDREGNTEEFTDRGQVNWVGARNKYFIVAMVPTQLGDRQTVSLFGRGRGRDQLPKYVLELSGRSGGNGKLAGMVYTGPIDYDHLRLYDVGLERAIDFGWPVVREISRLLLIVFKGMYDYVPNYGVVIIIFAVGIKLLVYPLTHKTYESTAKMQELQPKIQALKEKYGKDQQRLSKETMKLYKEEGVNPLGGCLPMILQMPIFFALYNLFGRTIELRRAPFVLWIQDLSVPDALHLGGIDVHVLPLVMAGSMLIQQKMTMKDPKQAMLVYLMPAVMVFIFWRMSSGLVLYWTVFNLLTILQQSLVKAKSTPGPVISTKNI